jgi:neutral ceramidase
MNMVSRSHRCTDRRRFLRALTSAATVGALAMESRAEAADPASAWRVGAGVGEITPPLEVGLLMSSGRELWEPFEGVRLPIHARALVVEKDDRRIALVALDLLGLAGEAVGGMDPFKQRACAAAGQVVRPDELILASTHTHSSPESAALTDLYKTEPFQKWLERLAQGIGTAVRTAAESARPCRLMTGTHPAPGMTVNRRIRTTRGIASVRHKLPADEVIGPEGPNDDWVRVCAFVDASDKPAAILVSFTTHPVLEMCIKQVSPDYPGEMCLELERRHPGAVPLFLQGATGNINPPTMDRSADNSRQYGQRLAELVDRAMEDMKPANGDELALRRKTIELPVRSLTGDLQPERLKTTIAALRIGSAAFVFLPGEPFVEIALAIRKASPWPFTAVVGYAEDYIGYIPTDRAFRNGGYEVRPGRWSRVAPGSEGIVRDEAVRLLKAL